MTYNVFGGTLNLAQLQLQALQVLHVWHPNPRENIRPCMVHAVHTITFSLRIRQTLFVTSTVALRRDGHVANSVYRVNQKVNRELFLITLCC